MSQAFLKKVVVEKHELAKTESRRRKNLPTLHRIHGMAFCSKLYKKNEVDYLLNDLATPSTVYVTVNLAPLSV
jgi:hypothetical protein